MKKSKIEMVLLLRKKIIGTPNLPENVINHLKRWEVRVIRVLGIFSAASLLMEIRYNLFSLDWIVLFMLIGTINLIYGVVLTVIRIKFMKKVLKSDALNIGEGEKGEFISGLIKVIYLVRGILECSRELGVIVGLGVGLDKLLKAAGREGIINVEWILEVKKIILPTKRLYIKYLEDYYNLGEDIEKYRKQLEEAIEKGREDYYIKCLKLVLKEKECDREKIYKEIVRIEGVLEKRKKS